VKFNAPRTLLRNTRKTGRVRAAAEMRVPSASWRRGTAPFALLPKLAAGAAVVAAWLGFTALGQVAVKNQGYVPFSEEPINYRSDARDPVALLQKRVDRGEVKLEYEPKHGYLKSVLNHLSIPIDTQTLVFSKTSFQYKKISPEAPRALYFNDDVYVGQVHDGKVLEFVSFDPMQGAIFYILDEKQNDHPLFQRAELDCTQCHVAAGTRNVPGVLLRSVYTSSAGTQAPFTQSFITGQESPLKERWGGWYVTGTSGSQTHMGNVTVTDDDHPEQIDRAAGVNLTDLSKKFDVSSVLLPGQSDIVAHLVLAHQTQMHNLITLTNYQTRIALFKAGLKPDTPADSIPDAVRQQYQKPAEQLVRYLLFADETPLEGRITGTSDFAAEFAARGPRDSAGRSLRDFDLRTRIFKYPCSYLIYSEAFESLPAQARDYVYHRLFEVLTGRDQSPGFVRLNGETRRAIFEILLATKPGLPAEWSGYKTESQSTRASVQSVPDGLRK
jgi:hypothetical protein